MVERESVWKNFNQTFRKYKRTTYIYSIYREKHRSYDAMNKTKVDDRSKLIQTIDIALNR